MSENNIRKINDLNILENIPEGSSLLINHDGVAKLLKADLLEKAIPLVVKVEVSGNSPDDLTSITCNVPYETLKNALINKDRVVLAKIIVPDVEVGDTTSANDGTVSITNTYDNTYTWFEEIYRAKVESGTYTEKTKIAEFVLIANDDIGITIFYTSDGSLSFTPPMEAPVVPG